MKRKIIKIFKQNRSAIICFVLALSVFVTGSVSFARYATSHTGNGGAGVGSFSCSATVDGVSALSFTNTAFWGGSVEEDKIAMNALRSLNFTVNNYEISNGVKRVSEVRLSYSLSFTAPANFADKLAIQLLDNKGAPILPQMIVHEIMNAVSNETGTGTYDTAKSEDYNGLEHKEMTFAVSKYKNGEGNTVVEAKATDGTVIKIETMEKEYEQTLLFRLWDVSKITSESDKTVANEQGELLPPLEVKYRDTLECYKISIRKADFVFPAAVESSASYSLTLAPTDTLLDSHLGGYAYDTNGDALTQIAASGDFALKNITKTTTYYTNEDYTTLATENLPHETNPYKESLIGGIPAHKVEDGEPELISSTDNGQLTRFEFNETETSPNPVEQIVYYFFTKSWNQYTYVGYSTKEFGDTDQYKSNQYYRLTRTYTCTNTTSNQYNLYASFSSQTTRKIITTEVSSDGNDVKQKIVDTTLYKLGNIASTEKITTTSLASIGYIDAEKLYKYNNYWGDFTTEGDKYSSINITNSAEVSNSYTYEETGESTAMSESEISQYENQLTKADETVTRYITIQYTMSNPVTVTPSSVCRLLKVEDTEAEYYDSENPLVFFDGNGIQKLYLSQCFSKDYPTSVSVLFEQVVD